MKESLLNRITKAKKSDVVHSSGYARVQNAGIGSTSAQSFAARRQIDKNRSFIRRYRDSKIVNEFGHESWRARKEDMQLNGSNKEDSVGNRTFKSNELRTRDTASVSARPNMPNGARTPSQLPARKNPGISR